MHSHSTPSQAAGESIGELELVNYGGGWAWLRAEHADLDAAIRAADQLDRAASHLLGDERVALTDLGRRALATDALFGPWPSVAEAHAEVVA